MRSMQFAGKLGQSFMESKVTPLLVIAAMFLGLISLLLPGSPSLVALAGLYTLSAGIWAISEPAETAMVADLTGSERWGRGYGLYDLVTSLGFTIGPLVGGTLYDTLGQTVPFTLNGIVLIASAVWVMLFLRLKADK